MNQTDRELVTSHIKKPPRRTACHFKIIPNLNEQIRNRKFRAEGFYFRGDSGQHFLVFEI